MVSPPITTASTFKKVRVLLGEELQYRDGPQEGPLPPAKRKSVGTPMKAARLGVVSETGTINGPDERLDEPPGPLDRPLSLHQSRETRNSTKDTVDRDRSMTDRHIPIDTTLLDRSRANDGRCPEPPTGKEGGAPERTEVSARGSHPPYADLVPHEDLNDPKLHTEFKTPDPPDDITQYRARRVPVRAEKRENRLPDK